MTQAILRALCLLLALTVPAACSAESPRDEAHRYELVGPVSEDFTWAIQGDDTMDDVYEQGAWYIIDVHGNRLTNESFTLSNRYFHEGLVTVWKDGRAGCIHTEGNVVIPFEWDDIYEFGNGVAAAEQENRWGVIDRQGNQLIPCEWDRLYIRRSEGGDALIIAERNGQYGLLSLTGKTLLPCEYRIGRFDKFSDGLLLVYREDAGFGFVNARGEIAIPCQWQRADSFSEGLAAVRDGQRFGFIDTKGAPVFTLPDGWCVRSEFHEGLAPVENGQGLYGYIDQTGALAIPCQWEKAEAFSEGLASVCLNEKCGFIDRTGAYISPCQWEYAGDFQHGYNVVRDDNGLMGIIDREGRLTVPCAYTSVSNVGYDTNTQNPAYVMKNRIQGVTLYGLIRADGQIMSSCQWSLISYFADDGIIMVVSGFVSASAYDEWDGQEPTIGFIDVNGNVIVPCEYDHGYYSNGYFTLIKDGYLTILDRDGNRMF